VNVIERVALRAKGAYGERKRHLDRRTKELTWDLLRAEIEELRRQLASSCGLDLLSLFSVGSLMYSSMSAS
jgi:hypothetical protein